MKKIILWLMTMFLLSVPAAYSARFISSGAFGEGGTSYSTLSESSGTLTVDGTLDVSGGPVVLQSDNQIGNAAAGTVTVNGTVDITSGALVLPNDEKILGNTAGEIGFQATGGSKNEHIGMDLETKANYVIYTTDTGVDSFGFSGFKLDFDPQYLGRVFMGSDGNYGLLFTSTVYGKKMQFGVRSGAGATRSLTLKSPGLGINQNSPSAALEVVSDEAVDLLKVVDNTTTVFTVADGGQVYGTIFNDQMSTMMSRNILADLTAPKLVLMPYNVGDNNTEQDISGQNNDMTYTDAANFTSTDQVYLGWTYGVDWDGTDDYTTVADDDSLSFGDGINDSAVSICVTANVADEAAASAIISKWDETSGAELREYRWYISDAEKMVVELYDESANVSCTRTQDTGMSAGYHHLCFTYDGAGGATACNTITLYVDGALSASTSANDGSYVAMENLATDVWIGAEQDSSGAAAKLILNTSTLPYIEAAELSAASVWKRYVGDCAFTQKCDFD